MSAVTNQTKNLPTNSGLYTRPVFNQSEQRIFLNLLLSEPGATNKAFISDITMGNIPT